MHFDQLLRRREFISLLGGAAAAWPLAARAQQASGMRRVGVLMGYAESDPEAKVFLAGFTQRLAELGWVEGRNLRMDVRWAPGSVDRMRTFARELVELQPDVILANSTPVTAALQRETRTIPIVFAVASDPVGSRFAASLARPGGNITGFSIAEPSLPGKWLELLIEIAPSLQRAAMMFNPDTASYVSSYYLPSFETAAQSQKIAPITARVRSDAEIEKVITSLGRDPRGGLLVMPDNFMEIHRAQIISLAARNKLPAIYQLPVNVKDGGLLSYGADFADVFRRAAPYVDLVLRGTMPSELPVQMPTKYVLAINAKTAKALGLAVPSTLLVRADEVIE
jgi:putative ABC transport system substrate-binding protein